MHARGYGAHGFFENYEPLTEITRADPFSETALRTPVFVRFSTVAGNKGSSDLARDVRGFGSRQQRVRARRWRSWPTGGVAAGEAGGLVSRRR